jgi:excisionase family DNA binding protein
MSTPLLTAADIGRLLNVSRATVYRWSEDGKLPHLKLGDRCIRYEEAEVLAWLAERRGARS